MIIAHKINIANNSDIKLFKLVPAAVRLLPNIEEPIYIKSKSKRNSA